MTAADLDALLDVSMDDVVEPGQTPAGSYLAQITNFEQGESSKKKTPFFEFEFSILDVGEDVDEEALEEAGGRDAIIGRTVSDEFYITEKALFMLKNFLENALGFEVEGLTLRQVLSETVPQALGQQVWVHVIRETFPRRNGETGTRAVIQDYSQV